MENNDVYSGHQRCGQSTARPTGIPHARANKFKALSLCLVEKALLEHILLGPNQKTNSSCCYQANIGRDIVSSYGLNCYPHVPHNSL